MKIRLIISRTFAALLGLAAGTAFAAEKWTAPQQEVAKMFDRFVEAMKSGDAVRTAQDLAPDFMGWDFAASAPMDRAAFVKFHEDFFAQWKIIDCSLTPTSIQIDRDLAITLGTGSDTMRSADGTMAFAPAHWSATLVRRGGQWQFVSWSWAEVHPALDETMVRRDVAQVMRDFIAACERADLTAAWAYQAAGPDYACVDREGRRFDAARAEKMWREVFARCSGMKYSMTGESVLVLSSDLALASWQGSADFMTQDGATLRYDPLSFTALLRRANRNWRMVNFNESSSPPRSIESPVAPCVAGTEVPREVLATLDDFFAAVNARDSSRLLDHFASVEDVTTFEDKELRQTRPELAIFLETFLKDLSQIQATWETRTVHELAPRVAVVTGTFKVNAKDTKGAPLAFRNAFTFVLVKQDERWVVKHVHESSLDLPAPNEIKT